VFSQETKISKTPYIINAKYIAEGVEITQPSALFCFTENLKEENQGNSANNLILWFYFFNGSYDYDVGL